MIDKKQLVEIMKGQHRTLQSDLIEAKNNADIDSFEKVDEYLKKFKIDLKTHLDLENGTFYPDYFKVSEEKGTNIEKIKSFISEMVEIGVKVTKFLDRYSNVQSIQSDKVIFTQDLELITKTLNLRIEMEEDGIYDIYAVS